jgi:hypothetical protein
MQVRALVMPMLEVVVASRCKATGFSSELLLRYQCSFVEASRGSGSRRINAVQQPSSGGQGGRVGLRRCAPLPLVKLWRACHGTVLWPQRECGSLWRTPAAAETDAAAVLKALIQSASLPRNPAHRVRYATPRSGPVFHQ